MRPISEGHAHDHFVDQITSGRLPLFHHGQEHERESNVDGLSVGHRGQKNRIIENKIDDLLCKLTRLRFVPIWANAW